MRICFFINDYSDIGGIQRITSMISSVLSVDNDVHIVSMYNLHGTQNNNLINNGVHIKTLIQGEKKYIRQALLVSRLLKEYIVDNSMDIVISTSEMLAPYCLLATRKTNTKYIVWTHTPPNNKSESILQGLFRMIAIKTSSLTITLTKSSMEELKNMYHVDHITYINNPIDPNLIKSIAYASDSKKIITVGRICYQKYYEKLIEVASILMPKYKDWTWDIYGDGDIDQLKEMIKRNKLDSQVFVLGNVDDIYNKYPDYSIQVMTSRYEGYPMTILEGLACGLPIVSFDIPGVNEIVKNNRNGFLVKPYNANEMSKKIEFLMNNSDYRKEVSLNNFEDRKKYNLEKARLQWEEIIKNTVGSITSSQSNNRKK